MVMNGRPLTYDEALQKLVDIVLESVDEAFETIIVARDLRGRLRLCVKAKATAVVTTLAAKVETALQSWFAGPVLWDKAQDPAERLAAQGIIGLAERERWPPEWPQGQQPSVIDGESGRSVDARWKALRPSMAKGSWLHVPARGEQGRKSGFPPVVSFHSFKGGVGRTTSAALLAYLAAEAGKNVVLVDLDLEAPGLHRVLGIEADGPGVLDHVLEWQATAKIRTCDPQIVNFFALEREGDSVGEGSSGDAGRHEKGRIWCLHAGVDSPTYLERLGHLDFATPLGGERQRVSVALVQLLQRLNTVKAQDKPAHRIDYIFLDARAGLHDLGGIALRDLADVHVLVTRANRQGEDGLRRQLNLLSTGVAETQPTMLVLQTFSPADLNERRMVDELFRGRAYDAFLAERWYHEDEMPELDDSVAPHFPESIPLFAGISSMERLEELLAVPGVAHAYIPVWKRLKDLLEVEKT
jgi:cellulose biosynthesis protein BcsQ